MLLKTPVKCFLKVFLISVMKRTMAFDHITITETQMVQHGKGNTILILRDDNSSLVILIAQGKQS